MDGVLGGPGQVRLNQDQLDSDTGRCSEKAASVLAARYEVLPSLKLEDVATKYLDLLTFSPTDDRKDEYEPLSPDTLHVVGNNTGEIRSSLPI